MQQRLFPMWVVETPPADVDGLACQIREYKTVVKRSRDRYRLWAANRSEVDTAQARDLLDTVLSVRDIPYELHFGRAERNSYGGVVEEHPRRGYLSLVTGEDLTIGTVLHEAAHVIGMWRGVSRGHDRNFSIILDRLLAETPLPA